MVEKEFYSVKEVSKILDMSGERVYEYLRTGYIRGSRLTKASAWRVHKDELQRIKAGKEIAQPEQQAPSGKLERLARMEQERVEPPLAREWGEQLSCPPPETVLIDSLGRMGDNSATLGQDILNVALENLRFDIRVSQTTSYPNYTHAGGQVFWELPLHGPPKLLCPVERRPGFEELLSKITGEARESFSSWKSLGGRFLVACMSARSAIQDEANARAGGLVTVNSLFAKIRSDFTLPPGPPLPSRLNAEFGDLIYWLSIKCKRCRQTVPILQRLYHIRRKGLFCDLVFGHQDGRPLASGLPVEIERWGVLHQSMIREFAQSKIISELIELHARILTLEKTVRAGIEKMVTGVE